MPALKKLELVVFSNNMRRHIPADSHGAGIKTSHCYRISIQCITGVSAHLTQLSKCQGIVPMTRSGGVVQTRAVDLAMHEMHRNGNHAAAEDVYVG